LIICKNVEIKITEKNIEYFKNLGYFVKLKDKIKIPIHHLSRQSHMKINVKCDICGKEKITEYRWYMESYEKYNIYCCNSTCAQFKNKKTNLEKYGVENYTQTNEFKEKFIQYSLNKYGVQNPFQNENIKNKLKETNLEKYGVENPSKNIEIQNKRKQTMLEKYGVEYYFSSEKFLEKSQNTSMLNYGVINPMMSDKMKKIMKEYYLENGFNVLTNQFAIYKREVYTLTKKVKNKLLELWDGNDFYDGEYIKDNFNLKYSDGNYPTIDHKMSIFEGFKNNIESKEIADLNNLCFTKRCINSKKHIKIDFTLD
jgi:ATP-dependent Lon protease